MEYSHNDEDEKKFSETLLENSTKVEIVKNQTIARKSFSPFHRQLMGCSAPILGSISIGNVIGYSSTLLRQLKENDSSIKINTTDGSWIASISTLAMAITCLFTAQLMEKYGRRTLLRIASVLFAVCWMIQYLSVNFHGLLFGRFMTGFSAGLISPTLSVYTSEITQSSYRGLFLSTKVFCASLGMLIPHALGLFFTWRTIAVICALVPLLGFLLTTAVPESPPWLVRKGRIEEAEKSFNWLRGHNQDAIDEFKKMVEGQKLTANSRNNAKGIHNTLKIVQAESFYKPMLIILLYETTVQASGPNFILFYTVTVLKDSVGEYINDYVASIILDLTRMLTAIVACVVVKYVGRRPLTAFSGLTTAATLLGLSAYFHYASSDKRLRSSYGIPLALYVLYMLFIAIGFHPLVVTLSQELLPLRYRAFGSSFRLLFHYVSTFIIVKISPTLIMVLGESGAYLLFGICCSVGTLIIMIFLPETQKKTLQEIEDSYRSSGR